MNGKKPQVRRPLPPPAAAWDTTEFEVSARGLTLHLRTQVGVFAWERLDTGTRLLLDVMDVRAGDRVLDLGCGYGALGVAAAHLVGPTGHVDLVDSNVIAVRLAEENLAVNGVSNARVLLSDCAQAVADEGYDVVLSTLPVNAGKQVVAQFLADAQRVLKPGGRFYFAGPKAGGIQTWIKRAAERFGNAETVEIGKGYRAAVAVRGAEATAIDGPEKTTKDEGRRTDTISLCAVAPPTTWAPDYFRFRPITVTVGGEPLEMISKPGIFSWDELDPATAFLLDHLEIGADDTVLDIGCGYGVIGVVAARRAPHGRVYLVDSNLVAAEAARRSVAHHSLTNAEVILGDGPAAIGDALCDVIVTNPPFHAGREVDYGIARRFIAQARPRLKKGGRFYLVCNSFIPYERVIAAEFGHCEMVAHTPSFKVLRAGDEPLSLDEINEIVHEVRRQRRGK